MSTTKYKMHIKKSQDGRNWVPASRLCRGSTHTLPVGLLVLVPKTLLRAKLEIAVVEWCHAPDTCYVDVEVA